MTFWPGTSVVKSTNNAFDPADDVRPSIFWTPQGETHAKRLEREAQEMTAKQRTKRVTALKPLGNHNVIAPTKGGPRIREK